MDLRMGRIKVGRLLRSLFRQFRARGSNHGSDGERDGWVSGWKSASHAAGMVVPAAKREREQSGNAGR